MQRLELKDFEPHVGTSFDVTSTQEDGTFGGTLQLTSARPYELHARDRRVNEKEFDFRAAPFSLFFQSTSRDRLPQRLYAITHPGFPEGLALFLVCIADSQDGQGYVYESVFN